MIKNIYQTLRNFKPQININELEYYLNNLHDVQVENSVIYSITEYLVDLAYPTYQDRFDRRWEYFYIPVKKCRRIFAIPFWIMEYNKEFFASIQSFGNFHIIKSNIKSNDIDNKIEKEKDKFFSDLIYETIRFSSIIKDNERFLEKIIPYNVRTGKIKGYHILDKLLSRCRKNAILDKYKNRNRAQIKEISLNDYLNVAGICYKGVYKEAENLSNIEMYKRWSDKRDGGMLSINDWNSTKDFFEWYHSGQHIGSHPFEIVFSWHQHGIHLYPPDSLPCYSIRVTDYRYAWHFIKMINSLIKTKISFNAENLNDVVDFLSGDTYFSVNKINDNFFRYIPSREYEQKYLPHIKWDDIKVVNWK